jgi:phosphohistidine phosphatase SixA
VTLPTGNDTRGPGVWWKNCETTRKLAPAAQPNARAIGAALQRLIIAVSDVQTSEFCRAYDTAVHLGLSAPQRNGVLNSVSAYESQSQNSTQLATNLSRMLSVVPISPANRILVGHSLPTGIVHPILSVIPEGHTAIFKPNGTSFHLVAVVSPGQWQWISKQQIVSATAVFPPQVTQAPPPAVPPQPLIDAAKELKGAPLLAALKRGGYNLYMRHALATMGQDGDLINTPMWWTNCAIQRNMIDLGKEQARKVGASIRTLKLPIGEIKTSQFCRVRETAELMNIGASEMTEDLNHAIAQRPGMDINATRYALLVKAPPRGKNNVFVSHTHGSPKSEERIMGGIQEAEIVVYLPDGKGNAEPIARIPVAEWDNLLQLNGTCCFHTRCFRARGHIRKTLNDFSYFIFQQTHDARRVRLYVARNFGRARHHRDHLGSRRPALARCAR